MFSIKHVANRTFQICIFNFKSRNYINSWCEPLCCLTDSWLNLHNTKQNHKRYFHNSIPVFAGHSKWSNIRHNKMANDVAKAKEFDKLARLIGIAVKDGGHSDPKMNSQLARIITQAKSVSMPSSTIATAIKKAEASKENLVNGNFVLTAAGGVFVWVFVTCDRLIHLRQQASGSVKKYGLLHHKSSRMEHTFEEKGLITAAVGKVKNLQQATDDAIEIGAEEVTEDDGLLIFTCDPKDFDTVRESLDNMKYRIEYASIDQLPISPVVLDDVDAEKYMKGITKLRDTQYVTHVYHNF